MSKTYLIAGIDYPSRKAVETAITDLIRLNDGRAILTGHDHEMAAWLWSRYPDQDEKIAGRLRGFIVRDEMLCALFPSRHSPFSYRKALTGKATPASLESAARLAIASDMETVRGWLYADHAGCQVCKREKAEADLHVHHAGEWRFHVILRWFIIDVGYRPICVRQDGSDVFANPVEADLWRAFHHERVDPLLVCESCHRRIHSKGGVEADIQADLEAVFAGLGEEG